MFLIIGFCVSLLLNVMLSIGFYIEESNGHIIGMAMERRDLIELKSRPNHVTCSAWKNSIEKLHMQFDVAFFGNSITCGSDFQQYFEDKKIINLGLGGDIIPGMVDRIPLIVAAQPQKVFIMAGTNDLFHVNIDVFKSRYAILLDSISSALPDAKIYIESVLPMNNEMCKTAPSPKSIQEANAAISKLAKDRDITFIDLYSLYEKDGMMPRKMTKDGIHVKKEYYDIWAKAIQKYIYE